MYAAGIIERSISPWASASLIVPKKDGDTIVPRWVHDYRLVNDVTKKDAHPLPKIDDILSQVENKSQYFTSLDLFSGYYQIRLTERAKERTAFTTPDGLFQYTRMPFG